MAWMVIIYSLIAATVVAAYTIPNKKVEWRTKNDPKPENSQV
jgi:hypothetical protein